MSYILFSPVGTTDPITQNYDGALLHICRHYKPEVVCLFYTAEMAEYRKKDNRYAETLKKLGEKLNHEFVIKEELRPDLVEVQRFDDFYRDFRGILQKLTAEYPEKQVLLNVSSGTPAIKSSLQTLAALSQGKYLPIQVSTPIKKSNPKVERLMDYAVELEWDFNEDNDEEKAGDRTSVSSSLNLLGEVRREIVKNHLQVYDYTAALAVARGIQGISADALRLLEIAVQRVQLNHSEITRLQKGTGFDIYSVKDGEKRSICEYLLWLQMKKERQEYADFIRGITPVFLDLCEYYLENICKFKWQKYCSSANHKVSTTDLSGKSHITQSRVYRLTQEGLRCDDNGRKLLTALNSKHAEGYRDSDFSSNQAVVAIEVFSQDEKAAKEFNILRDVESAVRNLAAHEIVSITDEWIHQRLGFYAEDIWNLIKSIVGRTLQMPKTFWRSYDEMNGQIEELLMK